MKIGIIGAGQIGGTLTRRFTALGHEVFVANSRGPETLSDLAAETGATAVSVPKAVRNVDLVVVTIPEKNISNLPAGLFADTPESVVVVDTGNYYPRHRDGRIEAIEEGLPESKWVAQQLGRPVIKAFNNIYAKHLLELGRLAGTPGRIALPVAGDDDAAKAVVLKLVDELGDAVDAGGWMNRGGNSPVRRFTPKTSTPRVYGVLWRRPPNSGPQNGVRPTTAPVASPPRHEACSGRAQSRSNSR
jgi:8-hydroxy-5-deazaflavin:NADPH oxidoreductase